MKTVIYYFLKFTERLCKVLLFIPFAIFVPFFIIFSLIAWIFVGDRVYNILDILEKMNNWFIEFYFIQDK